MSMYKYVAKLWKKPKTNPNYKNLLVEIRKDPVTLRLERPTRIDRARTLGYKAKEGFIVVRQRVLRGGHTRPQVAGGRRPKHSGRRKNLKISYQVIAEQRAAKKFTNCEVMNSYYLAEDGKHYWYEIIMIERNHPNILKQDELSNLGRKKGRAFKGLTSAGRKSRGMRHKGKGTEKVRPSLNKNKGMGN